MFFAAVTMGVGIIGFSGSFSKSAAPSGGYVTSNTITVSVPGGNSGVLVVSFATLVGIIGGVEYSKNGGAFTSISDGGTVTLANGDTLALRAGGGGDGAMTAGEIMFITLTDATRGVVHTYTLEAV